MKNLNRLPIVVHGIKEFTYNKETKTFITELSNIRGPMGERIYKDACDWGFEIKNYDTGVSKLFYHVGDDTDGEDICGYRFENDEGYKALIIND